ncbi:sulfite exporter TauE/SafE family protein [Spiroplasma platyhelix]|uniref:Anion permease n=1 Tax=Spiroplasma platyhelix PALS-1 TaxID=1276218 RepID=A0A846TZY8_9MOLU|nr:sulfite exporter TauE/SafE family protein [Spiroplasma platyhelix]MBE4703971.1 hypothetical protein [Spiroplasma platyhelix PALS-1]NKE38344.1 anion permease [Spiroplasma platyhelix PALS-1]UJB29229.1 hypothetical protein SPLAT_v1c04650 [Spiroplasma platyhelix PALS-1]
MIANKTEKQKKSLPPKYIAFLAIGVTLTLLLVSLLVNYLFYFAKANNGEHFNFQNSNHLTAFIFMIFAVLLILVFLVFIVLKVSKKAALETEENLFKASTVGYVSSFTDTIGIGSFAVSVAGLNLIKSVRNVKKLPGTLNLGLAIPNLVTGVLFVSAIQVELATLISLVFAAVLGAFCSARIVGKVNKKFVALFVSICLLVAGIFMILGQVELFGTSGTKGLHNWKLAVGIIAFFIIGGLQSFGIGLYAPALAVVSLLGMETIIAFPIMTCASGFAMPATALSFYKDQNYSPKVVCGLLIGGVCGTVSAFFIIFVGIQGGLGIEMSTFTYYIKWIAIAVMFYASMMLLRNYFVLKKESQNVVGQSVEKELKKKSL